MDFNFEGLYAGHQVELIIIIFFFFFWGGGGGLGLNFGAPMHQALLVG